MAINLTSTSVIPRYPKILIYAMAGWGKTEQCKNAPEPLIVSAEGGLLTLSEVDIPLIEIRNVADLTEVCDWLDMSNEPDKFSTICTDSLSEIAEVLLSDEMKKTKDPRQAYGVMHNEMSIAIRRLIHTQKVIYFTAKMKKEVDDKSKAVKFMPSAPGQMLLQALPYFFDEVLCGRYGQLPDGSQYRYIQTCEEIQYTAKDRSGTLEAIEEPDLGKIITKIKAGVRL